MSKRLLTAVSFGLVLIVGSGTVQASIQEGEIIVDGVTVSSIKEAQARIVDGSTVYLGPGIYTDGIEIKKNSVVLSGSEGTHFVGAVLAGKATIITSGNNITIENIECSEVRVSSQNGACIRHQGNGLTVSRVYFHDSEQGILEAPNKGVMHIRYSRFERLGKNGRAHGIYAHGGELLIEDSYFSAMVSEGHAVKSRSAKTVIERTQISTDNGRDSRLIDIPNGGELKVTHSILLQNSGTVNRQLIGWGLETISSGRTHSITVEDNLVIMEREQGNELLAIATKNGAPVVDALSVRGNVLIGPHIDSDRWQDANTLYGSRQEASMHPSELPAMSKLNLFLQFLSNKK